VCGYVGGMYVCVCIWEVCVCVFGRYVGGMYVCVWVWMCKERD